MKKRVLAALMGVALVFGCGQQDSKKQQPGEIKLGGIFPLTGGSATFGKSSQDGMQMAVDEFNAEGGILIDGQKHLVKPIYDDTAGQPEQAANICLKQLNQDKVTAIVGAVMSKNSLAIAPICQSNRIPMISSASTNPKVTEEGDYIFRVCFIDPFQGTVMANYVANNLGKKQAAVLYDNGNDYNKGLASFFEKRFTELGGTIVSKEAFTDADKTVDFRAQLTNIKSQKPEFLYLPNYYAASATILVQAKELGLDVPAGGGDGWDSPKLVEIGGDSVEGNVFSNHFSREDPREKVQSFIQQYKEKYGTEPDALASLAYDAAYAMLLAIKRAESTDGAKIRDQLKALDLQGVTGNISFDENRNPIKSAVILQIQEAQQKYVTTIHPE